MTEKKRKKFAKIWHWRSKVLFLASLFGDRPFTKSDVHRVGKVRNRQDAEELVEFMKNINIIRVEKTPGGKEIYAFVPDEVEKLRKMFFEVKD